MVDSITRSAGSFRIHSEKGSVIAPLILSLLIAISLSALAVTLAGCASGGSALNAGASPHDVFEGLIEGARQAIRII